MSSATMNDSMPQLRGLPVSLPSVVWWLERLPVAVLILSIAFLQGYALQFWGGLLGRSGWGVSFGLEVLHLWFWYRAAISAGLPRFAWLILAVVATGLLLAGALHEVTQPLLQESARIEVADQERKSLEAEARILTANLVAFRDMAAGQGRRGWQDDIRRDTARIQAIADRLRTLAAQSSNSARRPWMIRITHGGVIAVAVLFQFATVLAVWSLSGGSRKTVRPFRLEPALKSEPEIVSETISRKPETLRGQVNSTEQGFYRQLWSHIEAHARSNSARLARGNGKISQASLARDIGVSAPDLSGIKLLAQGQEVPRNPSRESVERLAERFSVELPK